MTLRASDLQTLTSIIAGAMLIYLSFAITPAVAAGRLQPPAGVRTSFNGAVGRPLPAFGAQRQMQVYRPQSGAAFAGEGRHANGLGAAAVAGAFGLAMGLAMTAQDNPVMDEASAPACRRTRVMMQKADGLYVDRVVNICD